MNKMTLAAAAACTVCATSYAETNDAETATAELPRVVVEASRTGKTAADIPTSVLVLDRSDIESSGAKSLAELFERKMPSLNITRTGAGNPALTQVAMRGWGENGFGRTLVMVDGRRLNFADMSAPMLSQIDLGSVQRIEVLHGSQCVLHGDAASAGAINVVTGPDDYDEHGRAEAHVGSRGTYGAGASFRGGDQESGVKYWANAAWDHSDGYRDNGGWQTWNAGGGLKKEWENGSFLRVDSFFNDSDYGLPGYLQASEWKTHRSSTATPGDWYRRRTAGANLSMEGVASEEVRLRLDAGVSRSKMKTRSHFTGSYTDYDPNNFWAPANVTWSDDFRQCYDLWSFDVTPQLMYDTEAFGLGSEFVSGASYRHDRLHGRTRDGMYYLPDFWGSSGITGSKYEYTRSTMAFFAQETLHLCETVAIEGGGRYQRAWDENTSLVSPRRVSDMYAADAALLFTPFDDFKSYVRFSRFFRSPFLDENPYANYKAQEILRPETGWSVNAGFDWKIGYGLSTFADLFYTKTNHEILYDKFFWGTNVNAPCHVVREGFSLGASWEREKTAGVTVAYTFVDAEFDGGVYDGKDVPMAPESTLVASGRVWIWDECFVFGGYRFVSSRRAYSDFMNEGDRLSSYSLFNIGVQYAPDFLKGLKATFSIDNLLDRHYADCSVRGTAGQEVYYPAAGRTVMFSIGYEF